MIFGLTLIVLRKELFYCNKDHLVLGKLNCMVFFFNFQQESKNKIKKNVIHGTLVLKFEPYDDMIIKGSNFQTNLSCLTNFLILFVLLAKIKEKTNRIGFSNNQNVFLYKKYFISLDISVST